MAPPRLSGNLLGMAVIEGSTGPPRDIGASTMRRAGSQSIADLPIGAHRGVRHHSATAKQYCPSSSAVVRQFFLILRRYMPPRPQTPPLSHSRHYPNLE